MRLPHQVGKCKYYDRDQTAAECELSCSEGFKKRAFYCTENDNKELWREIEAHPFQPPLWVDSNVRLSLLVSQRSLSSSLLFPMSGGGEGLGLGLSAENSPDILSAGQSFQHESVSAAISLLLPLLCPHATPLVRSEIDFHVFHVILKAFSMYYRHIH